MHRIDGFWFPYRRYKAEKIVLQAEAVDPAFAYVKNWTLAIDVGAYVGTMSRRMAGKFIKVVAFEPLPDAYECLLKNVPDNVECRNVALGDETGPKPYVRMNASGFAHFSPESLIKSDKPSEIAEMRRLDDLNLSPGFVKIDAEFTDENVLKGAKRTIEAHRPVLMVEIKGRPDGMDRLLSKFGYRKVEKSKNDAIYVAH